MNRFVYIKKSGSGTAGFTLIELVLYVAISATLLGVVMSLYFTLARTQARQQSIAEVEQQGAAALSLLLQTTRNAQFVVSPTPGTASTTLILTTYAAAMNPTVFFVASSTLYVTEGSSTPVALTNSQVVISQLSFLNVAASTTDGSIKVQFMLSYASTTHYETNYASFFTSSATVRNQQ